jgi:hypothetical protein
MGGDKRHGTPVVPLVPINWDRRQADDGVIDAGGDWAN